MIQECCCIVYSVGVIPRVSTMRHMQKKSSCFRNNNEVMSFCFSLKRRRVIIIDGRAGKSWQQTHEVECFVMQQEEIVARDYF